MYDTVTNKSHSPGIHRKQSTRGYTKSFMKSRVLSMLARSMPLVNGTRIGHVIAVSVVKKVFTAQLFLSHGSNVQ